MTEAGIASGVRRIEAVVGPAAVEYLNQVDRVVRSLATQLKVKYEEIPKRVTGETKSLVLPFLDKVSYLMMTWSFLSHVMSAHVHSYESNAFITFKVTDKGAMLFFGK